MNDIQTPRRELKIRRSAVYFFGEVRGVGTADEALSQVFNILHSKRSNSFMF